MASSMHDRFGADVRVSFHNTGDRQLFLVRGASAAVPMEGIVRSHGGRTVIKGATWLLAELPMAQAQVLRRKAGILSVGGVSVDPERFAQFQRAAQGSGIHFQ